MKVNLAYASNSKSIKHNKIYMLLLWTLFTLKETITLIYGMVICNDTANEIYTEHHLKRLCLLIRLAPSSIVFPASILSNFLSNSGLF